jgi:hypothetical protein
MKSIPRDDCQFTEAMEFAIGNVPGPATYGCTPEGPANPVTIRRGPIYRKVTEESVELAPKVFTVCQEHARHLRAYGYVLD